MWNIAQDFILSMPEALLKEVRVPHIGTHPRGGLKLVSSPRVRSLSH